MYPSRGLPTAWQYPEARHHGWYDALPETQPTDGQIKSQAVDRLRENPHTKDDDVRVDAKHHVVILTGQVSSTLAKRAAGDAAWDTQGVVDVSDQLAVANRAGR